MTDQIDDILELKIEIMVLVAKHLTGKCAQHQKKAMEWVRVNINTFVSSVERDLDYFAKNVIPVGEKLDAELREHKRRKNE
jgi:hypothetical protein